MGDAEGDPGDKVERKVLARDDDSTQDDDHDAPGFEEQPPSQGDAETGEDESQDVDQGQDEDEDEDQGQDEDEEEDQGQDEGEDEDQGQGEGEDENPSQDDPVEDGDSMATTLIMDGVNIRKRPRHVVQGGVVDSSDSSSDDDADDGDDASHADASHDDHDDDQPNTDLDSDLSSPNSDKKTLGQWHFESPKYGNSGPPRDELIEMCIGLMTFFGENHPDIATNLGSISSKVLLTTYVPHVYLCACLGPMYLLIWLVSVCHTTCPSSACSS